MMSLNFTIDGFRISYGLIAVWMWVLSGLFSPEYFFHERDHLKRYAAFTILTFIATEGVMFSADLMTTFLFFEILSMTSFVWVMHEETRDAIRAAKTYFFIAIIGGLVLFMGLALLWRETETLAYDQLHDALVATEHPGIILAAGICILLGFGAKAGMFPLHIWLPKSHPVAPSPASALLSGILTKVGIFGILMTAVPGFMGREALSTPFGLIILIAGTITMALGAVLALFSVNLKRTLACSSMSQIGFILVGIGTMILISILTESHIHEVEHLAVEAEELAHSGVVLHMVNHSLIKLVLFMAAGVVVMNLHKLNLNDIRGYGRNKLILMIPFALGALGISGIPFFNGYISKTLLHEGLVVAAEAFIEEGAAVGTAASLIEEGAAEAGFALAEAGAAYMAPLLHAVEWIFLISGGLTFAYMLKIFICIFIEKNPTMQEEYDRAKPAMNPLSSCVLLLSAIILPLLGQPTIVGNLAHFMTGDEVFHHFHAFTWTNLKGAFISLAIGAAIYILLVRNLFMRKADAAHAGKAARAGKSAATQKIYVDLWPNGLDLEDLIYRPMLLKILPGIGGSIASLFAGNVITAPLAKGIFQIGKQLATFFSVSFDGLLIVLRRTILREKPHKTGSRNHTRAYTRVKKAQYATSPILDNFSFALMMTAVGIAAVLLAILLATLR